MSKSSSWRGKPWVHDRRTALVGGYGFVVLGSLMLWDAYEARGKARPFFTKLLPGG